MRNCNWLWIVIIVVVLLSFNGGCGLSCDNHGTESSDNGCGCGGCNPIGPCGGCGCCG